jgi:DNA anti-recombination protein RmuC
MRKSWKFLTVTGMMVLVFVGGMTLHTLVLEKNETKDSVVVEKEETEKSEVEKSETKKNEETEKKEMESKNAGKNLDRAIRELMRKHSDRLEEILDEKNKYWYEEVKGADIRIIKGLIEAGRTQKEKFERLINEYLSSRDEKVLGKILIELGDYVDGVVFKVGRETGNLMYKVDPSFADVKKKLEEELKNFEEELRKLKEEFKK